MKQKDSLPNIVLSVLNGLTLSSFGTLSHVNQFSSIVGSVRPVEIACQAVVDNLRSEFLSPAHVDGSGGLKEGFQEFRPVAGNVLAVVHEHRV
jgi:hypothetical protein